MAESDCSTPGEYLLAQFTVCSLSTHITSLDGLSSLSSVDGYSRSLLLLADSEAGMKPRLISILI
ncbi:unnamed protein product [Protopolystoma xenopodis]|uniref:Uncharacterized protein n=1 Tax=Protopolystoma xenopodis TaxID=117903 RepID=A0A448XRS7_9PLAT|nr:unnamed protein product [Protopolystoma xenopodis]